MKHYTNQTKVDGFTTPITYYGGKQKMVKVILPLIPEHRMYVEPFVGGGAIFWSKPQSSVEVINDKDDRVVNFYRTTQTDYGVLRMLVKSTPHSRSVHREADMILKNPDCFSTIKRAWAFWVQTNMSFAGQLLGGWAYENKTSKTSLKIKNKSDRFLKYYQERLSAVQIECNDVLTIIQRRDNTDTFFYCDPPYYNANMGHYGGYTKEDFIALLDALSKIKGKFLLSSYLSDVLKEYTDKFGWQTKTYQSRVSVTHLTNKIKTEVLTANYNI